MDTSFMEDVDFDSLRIDPVNYELPLPILSTSTTNNHATFHKFNLPAWASFPGPSFGTALHICSSDGKTATTMDLDLPEKKYYLFGRNPYSTSLTASDSLESCGKGIEIAHANASRQHFAIVHSKHDNIYLIDLNSTYGTFLGKTKVQPYVPSMLKNGNVISIGGGWPGSYLVRIFPKKIAMNYIPFSRFSILINAQENDEESEQIDLDYAACKPEISADAITPSSNSEEPNSFRINKGIEADNNATDNEEEIGVFDENDFLPSLNQGFSFASVATPRPVSSKHDDEIEETETQTKLHTHLNQVPDLPSPRGQHLIKPSSFYTISKSFAEISKTSEAYNHTISSSSPLERSPLTPKSERDSMNSGSVGSESDNSTAAQRRLTKAFSAYSIPVSSSTSPAPSPVDQPFQTNVIPKFIFQPMGFHTNAEMQTATHGILKKFGSSKRLPSFRKVSFYENSSLGTKNTTIPRPKSRSIAFSFDENDIVEKATKSHGMSPKFGLGSKKSQLNISSTINEKAAKVFSDEENDEDEEIVEAVEFDPSTDLLPEFDINIDIGLANARRSSTVLGNNGSLEGISPSSLLSKGSASSGQKLLRAMSEKNVRKRFQYSEEAEDSTINEFQQQLESEMQMDLGIDIGAVGRFQDDSQLGFGRYSPGSKRQVKKAKSFHVKSGSSS